MSLHKEIEFENDILRAPRGARLAVCRGRPCRLRPRLCGSADITGWGARQRQAWGTLSKNPWRVQKQPCLERIRKQLDDRGTLMRCATAWSCWGCASR